jgi:hypothetical protein
MGETAQEVKQGPGLFSAEERRAIVRSFIEQYIAGKVRIMYWNVRTRVVDIETGQETSGAEKAQSKVTFVNQLETLCKADDATIDPHTMQNAIDALFDQLVVYRSGGFIDGEFPVAPIAESRLAALEARTRSIEELLEELKNILKVKAP